MLYGLVIQICLLVLFSVPSLSMGQSFSVPSEVTVTTSSEISLGMFTAIPRWKLAQSVATPTTLWMVHGRNGNGGSVWMSSNSGSSWSTVGTQVSTDYHANLDIDSSGRIYIGVPVGWDGSPDDPGVLRRWNGSLWDSHVAFDDFSGAYSLVNILKGNGTDVFAFVRSGGGGSGTLYWHRSTDNGATFGSANTLLATGDTNYKRIAGTMISGQPAVLMGYVTGSVYRYRIFWWDGSSFVAIPNDTLDATTKDSSNRFWTVNQTNDGVIHCVFHDYVGGAWVLRYAHKTVAGSWSSPVTIHTLTGQWDGKCILSVKGNYLFLAYTDTRSSVGNLFARWLLSGGSWSGETQLDSSGGVGNANSCRVVHGTYWPVAWDENAGGGQRRVKYLAVGISFSLVSKGDLNNNGVVDLEDAILASKVIGATGSVEQIEMKAEVNGDGKIGIEELIYILGVVSGIR
jgi:hypothetical protein